MSVLQEEFKHTTTMRVLGWLLIVLSVVEFGVGGAVYGFLTNVHFGAWWGGICCFITGVCGALSNSRPVLVTGIVFSVFAIIIAVVGATIDGFANAIFVAEDGCTNIDTFKSWGTTAGKAYSYDCAIQSEGHQCYCSDGSFCFGYDLASGDNCGLILTTYTSMLSTSTAMLSILSVVCLAYSIFTCTACCGPSYTRVAVTHSQSVPTRYAPQPHVYTPQPVAYTAQPQVAIATPMAMPL